MKLPILWSDAGSADMAAIFRQILEDSPQGALLVDDRINEQVELLSDFRFLGRAGSIADTRELVIERTAYVVVYRVEEDAIRILRVLHGAQEWPDAV